MKYIVSENFAHAFRMSLCITNVSSLCLLKHVQAPLCFFENIFDVANLSPLYYPVKKVEYLEEQIHSI